MRLAAEPLLERSNQARLSDARLAGEQHQLAFTLFCLPPTPEQQLELLVATDERRHRPGMHRLKSALDSSLSYHLPGRDRVRETLQRDQSEIPMVEQTTDLPPGHSIDHDTVGLRQPLQASGQVRGLPNRRLLSCLPRPDRLADNHQPGGDPDSNLQWLRQDRRSSNCIDNRKGSTNSAFGIRLMRVRPAEVDEDAVTYISGDEASEARDRRGHAGLVATDHSTQILRVYARR